MNNFSVTPNCPSFNHVNLIKQFGSPLLLFFPEILEKNINVLREALAARYPKHEIAYSVKTNYLPAVIRRVVGFGVVPEVIPGLELDMMERLGLADNKMIVNGPLKTESELRQIIKCACRINVDNLTELEILEHLGKESESLINIGLRIASEIGHVSWGRFGFEPEGILPLTEMIKREMPHLKLVGLHAHGGTNITDTRYYHDLSTLLCGLGKLLRDKRLMDLDYLDFGGGFATDCPFKDHEEWLVPSAAEYAEAIISPVKHAFGQDGPNLIVEPGRFLIDDAFVLLTTVERFRAKESREVVVDAGVNVLPSARFRRHRITCLTQPRLTETPVRDYTIFGPLCMPSDCLKRHAILPELKPGDILAIDFAGAYSVSQSWTFIRPLPAIVAIEKGNANLVRRAQSIDDFLGRDIL